MPAADIFGGFRPMFNIFVVIIVVVFIINKQQTTNFLEYYSPTMTSANLDNTAFLSTGKK